MTKTAITAHLIEPKACPITNSPIVTDQIQSTHIKSQNIGKSNSSPNRVSQSNENRRPCQSNYIMSPVKVYPHTFRDVSGMGSVTTLSDMS